MTAAGKSRLGGALAGLGSTILDLTAKPAVAAEQTGSFRKVQPTIIHADPTQPRRKIDQAKIEEMSRNWDADGQLQPIVIRPHPEKPGEFMLVMGHRRWRTALFRKDPTIDAVIREDFKNVLVAQIAENVQREDLDPLDLALAIARLNDYGSGSGSAMKAGDIAKALGKSPAWVSDHLVIKELNAWFRQKLEDGTIQSMHVCAELHRLEKKDKRAADDLISRHSPENPLTLDQVRRAKVGTVKPVKEAPAPTTDSVSTAAAGSGASAASAKPADGANPPAASSRAPDSATPSEPPASNEGQSSSPTSVLPVIHVNDAKGEYLGQLCLDRGPAGEGKVYVRDGKKTFQVEAASVRIARVDHPES